MRRTSGPFKFLYMPAASVEFLYNPFFQVVDFIRHAIGVAIALCLSDAAKANKHNERENTKMKMNVRNALTAVAMMGFALSAMAYDNRGSTGGPSDRQIQSQVTEKLAEKKQFQNVTANVDDGIVTLAGDVELYIEKVNAEKRTRKVKSVDGVRNHIQVEGKDIADAELRDALANKLRYDRVGYGIVFNNLTVAVDNGTVTVGGKVRDYPDRDSAIAIVETAAGVKDVADEIDVAPLSSFDDDSAHSSCSRHLWPNQLAEIFDGSTSADSYCCR